MGGNGVILDNGHHQMVDSQMQDGNEMQEMIDGSSGYGQDLNTTVNIVLTVKNIDNLDEYTLKTFLYPDYIPKLQKWIDKNKYRVEESMDDVKLRVQIFCFSLKKGHKTDTTVIRQEM